MISKEEILHLHFSGFKFHPLAYQLQYQAASDHEIPIQGIGYNNGNTSSNVVFVMNQNGIKTVCDK